MKNKFDFLLEGFRTENQAAAIVEVPDVLTPVPLKKSVDDWFSMMNELAAIEQHCNIPVLRTELEWINYLSSIAQHRRRSLVLKKNWGEPIDRATLKFVQFYIRQAAPQGEEETKKICQQVISLVQTIFTDAPPVASAATLAAGGGSGARSAGRGTGVSHRPTAERQRGG